MRCRVSPFIAGLPAGQRHAGYRHQHAAGFHRYQCAFRGRMSGETEHRHVVEKSARDRRSIATETILPWKPADQRIKRRYGYVRCATITPEAALQFGKAG